MIILRLTYESIIILEKKERASPEAVTLRTHMTLSTRDIFSDAHVIF